MTVTDLIAWVFTAGFFGTILINAERQRRERKKLDRYMAALQDWGYYAGKLGKPPDFHRIEKPELDWADRFAVSVGWQQGFDEYIAERKKAKP